MTPRPEDTREAHLRAATAASALGPAPINQGSRGPRFVLQSKQAGEEPRCLEAATGMQAPSPNRTFQVPGTRYLCNTDMLSFIKHLAWQLGEQYHCHEMRKHTKNFRTQSSVIALTQERNYEFMSSTGAVKIAEFIP